MAVARTLPCVAERTAALSSLQQRLRVVRAGRHALRMRRPDEPDIGHAVSRHAQTIAALVPSDMGDLRTPARDLGGRSATCSGARLLRNRLDLGHRIRRAMVRENREGLQGCVQVDETYVGGKNSDKAIVLVAGEEGGRVRLIHAPGNHEDCIKHVVDDTIEADAALKTDGHAAYNARSLTAREHDAKVQSSAEKKNDDHVQLCHWAAAALKRWLLGTHHGAVSDKHLQSYLDEHAFRHNRRKSKGVGRLVARCLENMLARQPLTMRQLIHDTHKCRTFEGVAY